MQTLDLQLRDLEPDSSMSVPRLELVGMPAHLCTARRSNPVVQTQILPISGPSAQPSEVQ